MNDEIQERLEVIILKKCHFGFVSFWVREVKGEQQDERAALLDKCLCLWDLLPENEKLSWDILVELQGGPLEVLRTLKREN